MNRMAWYSWLIPTLGFLFPLIGLMTAAPGETPDQPTRDLVITNVSVGKKVFDPTQEQAQIIYRLSKESRVSLRIYDRDDFLVRTVIANEPAGVGINDVSWDGKDESGKYLAPGAYTYVFSAEWSDAGGQEETVVYDRTDESFGKELVLRSLTYDASVGTVEYVLPQAGMMRIRVGMKDGGPLLATLRDWQPQEAGRHRFMWDGGIGVEDLNLQKDPAVQINLTAYSLPDNCIIVRYTKVPEEGFSQPPQPTTATRPKKDSPFKKYLHALHSSIKCREPKLSVQFPTVLESTTDGIPVMKGVVPVRIILDEQDKKLFQDERFEIVLFVDFVFLHEEEQGISPTTYLFDTKGISEGRHFLTVNLYSFRDHLGTITKPIYVRRSQ